MGRTNHVTAYQKEKNIEFSASSDDPLASYRISGIKGPVFEQWYFDSVADDGKAGLVFTLARDASYALVGKGHLRVQLDLTFPDGSYFNHVDWMSEAVIQDASSEKDPDGTGAPVTGVWTAPNKTHKHTIAADGSSARVDVNSPDVKGYFTLSALSPPMYPGGETHDEVRAAGNKKPAPTELQPGINLLQVIPTAVFEANLTYRGRPLRFRGIGGHMHVWATGSWFDTTRAWRVCRGVAGPWSVTCMEYTDMEGLRHSSGYVSRSGKKHFGAMEVYRPSETAETPSPSSTMANGSAEKTTTTRVRWVPTYNTGFCGRFADTSTGCILHFSTGVPGEEWQFEFTHRRTAFETLFGNADTGLTAFLGEVSGGKVGEESYRGVQFTDVCVLPRKSAFLFPFLLQRTSS